MRHSRGIGQLALCVQLVLISSATAFAAPAALNDDATPVRRLVSPLRVQLAQPQSLVTSIEFDRNAYANLAAATSVVLTDFPLDANQTVSLELKRVEVFTPNAIIVMGTANGDVPIPRPDVILLSGQVEGQENSFVYLGITPHGTNGIIEFGGQTHVISSKRVGGQIETGIYNLTALPEGTFAPSSFQCGTDTIVQPNAELLMNLANQAVPVHSDLTAAASATSATILDIAVETDWEFTGNLFGGDMDASGAYAALLLGAVSEIYVRDVNTIVQVGYLRLWPDSNDPWTTTNSGDRLGEFRSYWRSNMTWLNRNVAHFVSGRGLGGGIAYLNALCSTNIGYAVSGNIGGFFPYPTQDNHSQNWDLMVVAHELGHNCGAPHTHDMNPKIDNCAGGDCSVVPNATIMSYCHQCSGGLANMKMEFHARMIDERLLPFIGGASCLLSTGPPSIFVEPSDTGVCEGETAFLSVVVSGSPPMTYEWRKDGVPIPSSNDNILTISDFLLADEGAYDVVVTNAEGTANSAAATLSLIECGPPSIAVAGCRQLDLSINQPGLTQPVGLQLSSPDYPCLTGWLNADGDLVSTAVFMPADQWGTLSVNGPMIAPGVTYEVRTDFGIAGLPSFSDATSVVQVPWGDVVGGYIDDAWLPANGTADFDDISATVDRFRALPTAPPLEWCDLYPVNPDGTVDFDDISSAVDGFRNLPYPFGPPPCP